MLLRLQQEGAKIGCATLWGVTDRFTWLRFFRKQESHPLLFDGDMRTKPAFDAVMDAVKRSPSGQTRFTGIAEHSAAEEFKASAAGIQSLKSVIMIIEAIMITTKDGSPHA